MMSDARRFECPKCGAEPGKKCRTISTNRSTDDHADRWWLVYNTRLGLVRRAPEEPTR